MKKIYLFLLLCCLNLAAFGTTVTIFSAGSSGTYTTGYVLGVSASLTRTDGDITIEAYRTTSTTAPKDFGYMVFDLSAIAKGSTINSVTLGYYIQGYTASTAGTAYYITGFPGDLSMFTDVQSLNNAVRFNKTGSGGTMLKTILGSSGGLGTATGHMYKVLDGYLANSWFSQYAGGKASICLSELGTTSSARIYNISGEAGSGGSDSTTTNHIPYLTIDYTDPSSSCSGAPATANAAASPRAGTSATGFVLELNGATIATGLTYQWKSSSSLGGTYTNISGATSPTWTFTGVSAKTYYACDITCTASSTTTTSNIDSIDVIAASSCTPSYSNKYYADYGGTVIGGMTLGIPSMTGDGAGPSLADSTKPNAIAYLDATGSYNLPAVRLNKTYTHTFNFRTGTYGQYLNAWIDFNNNGTFESSEFQGSNYTATSGSTNYTASFSAIPATVSSGYRRMRIVSSYYGSGITTAIPPCPPTGTSLTYGETRDYLVDIENPAPSASATPSSLAFTATTAGTTSGTLTTAISGLYLLPSSGSLTVTAPSNYDVSPDGSTWYSTSYSLSYTSATYSGTIYVRFNAPSTAATYTGNVSVTGGGLAATLNIPVSAISAAICSGTPTAGTASTSATGGGSTTPVTLSVTGYTAAGGITFQWQSATSASGTFTNISGATNPTYSYTGITSTMYYQCVVGCSATSTSATTNAVAVYYIAASSCTPTWYYTTPCSSGYTVATSGSPFVIAGVTTLSDGSCTGTGYTDSTSSSTATMTTTLNAGSTYSCTGGNTYGYNMNYQMWIDFNNDGTFQTSESVGGISTTSSYTPTWNITIPSGSAGITPGVFRMRVIAEYYYHHYPSMLPCPNSSGTSNYYGQVRDYKVTITVPPVGSVTPSSLAFAPTVSGTSSTALTSALSGSFLSPSSGSLTVTAPSGFDVFDPGSSSWVSSYTVSYSGATYSATLQVRFSPSAVTSYSGNVTVTGGGLSTLNIAVTGTGATACSGTPTAGTATTSPSAGGTTTAFALSLTGYTSAGGLTFQWQSSSSAGGTFTNISGATNINYSFTGVSATTYYQCVVTCSFSGSSATSSVVTVRYYPPSSCTPNWYYSTACSYGMTIATTTNHFKVAGVSLLDDGNACAGGYTDYSSSTSSSMTTTLNAGSTYSCSAGETYGYNMNYQMWIDFNGNGAFESTESVGGLANTSATVPTWNIVIPAGSSSITPGVYRMRVEAEYYYHRYPSLLPCPNGSATSNYYGEVRDYKITLNVPPVVAITPTTMPFPPTVPSGGSYTTLTSSITASFLSPSTGSLTVTSPSSSFQVSPDGSTWASSYTIGYTGGATTGTIYVRFVPAAVTSYSGNVTITGGSTTGLSIAVTGTGAAACSGTPTAGTASISPAAGAGSTSFTLTNTGYTASGGISFQWQSSSDSSSWSNISGATLASYSFTGISATTYYRCNVTCSFSSTTVGTYSTKAYYFPSSSCTPRFYYSPTSLGSTIGTSTNPFRMVGFSGSINDASNPTSTGYTDLSATLGCTVNAGATYTATTGSSASYALDVQAWIDFNSDGAFQTSEVVGGAAATTASTHPFNVVMPAGDGSHQPGVYRMRVATEYYYHHYPNLLACPNTSSSSSYYGEVRDYYIIYNVPPAVVITPTTMAFPPTTTGTSSSTMISTYAATFLSPASGTLTVTAPSGYEVYNGTSWVSSYTISYSGAANSGSISVRFSPGSVATYTGNVSISGGGLSSAVSNLNIAVSGTGAAACSGTPTAGTSTVSPTAASSGTTTVSLSVAGYSATGGIQFQWQYTGDTTTAWNDISGGTTAAFTYTVSLTSNMYYRCKVTCPFSSSNASTYAVKVTYITPSSCTPSFTYGTSSVAAYVGYSARPFTLVGDFGTSLVDADAPSTGYANKVSGSYTCTLTAGSTYTATCGNNYGYSMNHQIWIDFNNDGTFQSTESVGGIATTSSYTPTFSVVVPAGTAGVSAGVYRMRVEAEYYYHRYPSMLPCPNGSASTNYYGEARDYRVTIVVPPTGTRTPTSLSFSPTVISTSSASQTSIFSGLFLTPTSGTLTVTAPTGFDVSSNGTTWGSSYTISYTSATSSSNTIYVRFSPSSAISYTGNVTITGGGLSGQNIAVTGTGAAICSSTPSAGTASVSPTTGASGTTFNLSLSGVTVAGGLTYQWESSPTGTGSWTAITGATNSTYSVAGISSTTYYHCIVTCPYGGSAATSGNATATWVMPSSTCTPSFYYASYSCSSYGGFLANSSVHLKIIGSTGSIDDGNACTGTGYSDYSSTLSCTLLLANSYTMSVAGSSLGETYQAWIDFNSNGAFESSETVGGLASSSTAVSATSFTVTLPSGAGYNSGVYRMRVMGYYYNYGTYPTLNPCPNSGSSPYYYYGEVRDYKVIVNAPPPFAVASPTSLSFGTIGASTTSSALSFTLSAYYLTPSSGTLTVTAPTNYLVSNSATGTFSSSYTISYGGGSTTSNTVYVKFAAPSTAGTYATNVAITGGGLSSAYNVAVTGNSAYPCTGTPTAGTLSASPSAGLSTTTFALTLSGATVGLGMQYQWQSSTSGASGSFSDITGATNVSYNPTGLTTNTYFQCIVTCAYSGISATSNVINTPIYCLPDYYYGGCSLGAVVATGANHLRLNGVSGTSLNDGTACTTASDYVDNYGSMSVTLNAGTTYVMTTGSSYSYNMNYQVWVDFNNDGVFQSTETVGGVSTVSTTVTTFNVVMPAGSAAVAPGTYRMRVEAEYYYHHYPTMNPCPDGTTANQFYYGEVRDYKLVLNVPPVSTVGTTSMAFPATTVSTSSAPISTTFTGSYLTPASGSITVTAPGNFQVYDPGSSSWVSSYTVSYSGSTYTGTIQVQFNPSAVTSYSGNVTITGGGISTTTIAVTGNGAPLCSGTPTAGTASVSPTSGNAATAFTLSLSGYTALGGITFQWQSSPDSSSWTNISGATLATYNFTGITANRYYRCNVTCTPSSSSASTYATLVRYFPASSCTPAWYYAGTACSTYGMVVAASSYPCRVVGASGSTFTDATACTGTGYKDLTSTYGVTMTAGSTYSITCGNSYGYSMNNQVWIDFNNNGTFESSESVGGVGSYSAYSTSFSLVIPAASASITPGIYRMRVEAEYNYHHYPSMNPCPDGTTTNQFYYGEVRDYKVTLNCPPAYTLSPASIAFPPTTTGTSSAGVTSAFSGLYLTPASGSMTVVAPSNFDVYDPGSSSWVSSYTIAYTGSTAPLSVQVRFSPTSVTTYSGNVAISGGGISTANIAVTGTGAAACSGTPSAGTASASPTSGSGATAFTLTVTGYTATGGIQFQWQQSSDSTSWSDISGATLATYTFTGVTANKYFRCNVTCPYSSTTTPTYAVLVRYFPASSCTPAFYYASNACSTYGMVVASASNHFMVNGAGGTSINDGTSCTGSGYLDQSASYGCTLNAGTTYTFTTGASYGSTMNNQVWIDFNNNGVFESTESVGGRAGFGGVTTFSVVIPSGSAAIQPGIYRMRVEAEYNYHTYPSLNPCPDGTTANSFYYGEVRDYKVTLNVPPVGAVSATSLTFPTTTIANYSAPLSSNLTASYLSPASGNLTVTAPSGFFFYIGGSYVSSYTIAYSGSVVASTPIAVYFYPTSAISYTGNVTVTGGGLTTLNIAVTGTGSSSCTSTPSAGTAVASPSTASPATSVTLSLTGTTVAGGLTYQWQSSATSGGTYTAITGATNPTYTFSGLGATTYYNCLVTCPYGGTASTSSYATVNWTLPSPSCSPNSTYSSCGVSGISSLTIPGSSGSISDGNYCTGSYQDRTTYSCTMYLGYTYNSTLNFSSTSYGQDVQYWIDFNSDGVFQTSETVGGANLSASSSGTASITIPSSATPATYRMRMITVYNAYSYHYPTLDPCLTGVYYGECRDYKVIISNPPPTVTRTPATLAFGSVTTGSTSSARSFTINGSYLLPSSGTLTITAPASGAQFNVSNSSSGGFASSYTISYTGGTISSVPVYVNFAPTTATSYSGNVAITGGGLSTAVNVAVTGTGAAACSTTPTAGTATTSPSTGSTTTSFTLGLSGATSAGGLTYQWQSSLTGTAGSFTNITGATTATYTFTGISANTYYQCVVGCSFGGSTATSTTVLQTYALPAASCTPAPTYAYNACYNYTMNFTTVNLVGLSGSISDNAACDGSGYKDRTSLSCTLLAGTTYTLSESFTTGTSSYTNYSQWWIDFNNDGTFQTSESVGGNTTAFNTGTVTLTIPSTGITAGTYRMRGVCDYNGDGHSYPSMNPCMTGYNYGEARDYKVIVVVPTACSGTPTAGSVSATATSGCAPVSSTLSLPGTAGVTGLGYQWYSSATGAGGSFSAISGATNATYGSVSTASSSVTPTYYNCVVTCLSSSASATSSTQSISATPSPGSITGGSTACVGGTTSLSNSLSGGTWSSSATGIATVNPSTGVVTGNSVGSCTISYTTSGCSPATASFTVNGSPAAITGFTGICVGGTSTLHDATTGGTWSSSDATIASVNSSTGAVYAVASGSATISYGAGCGTPATFSWTTATTPTAITGPTSICVSTTGTFSNAVSGGTWSNSPSTYGTIDASTGVFTATTSVGTSTLTYTIGYCSVTGTATVANTSPGTISGTLSACAGSTSTLTDASTGGAWSSSNTAVATINSGGVVTGVSSGTSTITYSTGCGTDATATFTVNGSPVSISSTTVCSQSTLNMTANVGAGTYTYSWSGPGGFTSTVQSPAISSASTVNSGIYSVTATQSGCSVSTSAWVSVDTTPVVSVTASPASICPGSTSTLTAAVTSPAAGSSSYAVYAIPYAPLTLTTVSSGPSGINGNSTVSMPFSFNFYGTSYNSVTISTNGYINFGTPSTSWTVVSLPSSSAPLGMIAPFWHYMNAGSGTIKYATLGTAPNRKFVVRYSGVSDYTGTGTNSAQVILYETSNVIEMFISQANTTGTYSGVCGIQNVSGSAATTVRGQNNVNYSINNTTAGTGWRFVNPSYSYTWTPSTGLSSTTITNPVASGLTSSQTYSVTSIDAYSGCTTGNVSSTTVNLYSLPTAYALSPSNGCTGVTHITIPSSETTATYQLYRGATAVGSPVTGTGSALDFGTQSVTGTYSVVATLASGGCTTNMTGTTVITASPVVYALTGGNGCTGTGVTIGVSNSESAVNYQLWNSGSTVGSSVSGSTGSPISFGSQTAAGTYTAIATAVTGGCQSTMSGSSVITTAPVAYAVGGGTGCSATGVTVTLPNSETGVSYQLKRGGTAVGSPTAGSTGSALSFGLQTTPGTYTIEATGSASCTTTMTGSAVVNQTPGITLGANPSVCQPLTSTSITYSSPVGSPTSYSITWGSSAITDGFSNVTSATLTGGSITLNIPSTSASGVYTGTISVSNGSCGSSSYSFTLTVYAVPNASISSVTAPCMGYATTIAFTGTPGADVDYTVDGGSTLTGTLTGGAYSFSSGAMTSAHTYVLVNAHNPVCTTAVAATVTVTPTPMQWTGATSSDWNDAANWTCGFVPGSSDDAAITASFVNAPAIAASASGTTRNLDVNAAATITVNASAILHVQGNLTNNGAVTGAGVLSMDGSGAQTVSGTGAVAKFDVNNTSGVTVNTGALLTVKNVLSVTSGSLATSDSVVLYSDTTVNARVATLPSGSSITGKVQVQQFMSAGRRAYRFWATPFSNSIALSQLTTKIDITGTGGATNGFTTTGTNAPSAYRYNPLVGNSALPGDPGWRPFTSANSSSDTNALNQYQGIRVYYRGAKGEGLGYGPFVVISHTTIMQTGNLNQGNQNITLAKGSSTAQDYNMVGNPYASPVDIGTVIYNAANAGRINGSRFYIWNPFLGTAGQFQSIQYSTCDCSSGGTAIPYYIQANNAFQVRAAHNGDQLNFAESNKGSNYSSTNSLMKTTSDVVSLGVYDANYHPYDMLDVRFDDAATADEDSRFDAGKPSGAEFNFYSLSADNHMLALDARPYQAHSSIPLGVNSAYAQDFIIRTEQLALPTGGKVYLHDKLLKQYVLLQQGTEYRFSVTKDNNTQGNDRFELSMEPQEVASIQAAKSLEVTMTPNPANDEVKVNFTSGKKDEVKVRVLDLSGVSVYNQDLGMKQSGTIMVPLSSLASGIYMVELTSGDQKVVQRLIKE